MAEQEAGMRGISENTTLSDAIFQAKHEPIAVVRADGGPVAVVMDFDAYLDLQAEYEAVVRMADASDESIPLEQALGELGIC